MGRNENILYQQNNNRGFKAQQDHEDSGAMCLQKASPNIKSHNPNRPALFLMKTTKLTARHASENSSVSEPPTFKKENYVIHCHCKPSFTLT